MTTPQERHDVVFDMEAYTALRGDVGPRATFEIPTDRAANQAYVQQRLGALVDGILREPGGPFEHPFVVPGSIYSQLWDWDAYFTGMALPPDRLRYYRGSVLNFLQRVRDDGQPAKLVEADGTIDYGQHAMPLQAQWCVAAARLDGDWSWIEAYWPRLQSVADWFEEHTTGRRGLFVWMSFRGNGIDNNPAVYGRPPNSSIGIDLNAFHYREYRALAAIAKHLGDAPAYDRYTRKAAGLRQAVNRYLWDPVDGSYYNADNATQDGPAMQAVTWEILLKIKSWATLFPLWARLVPAERAATVIERHVLNPERFLSPFGIRGMAADEPFYCNDAMGAPSNWNGPVWGLSTFLTAYAIASYGYRDAAIEAASRLIDVFAGDLKTNDLLHEYYHADTGAPMIKPGFLSWNILALRVLDDLREGIDPFALGDEESLP